MHGMHRMAEARTLHLTRSTGRQTSDGELSVILNSDRKILRCWFIRAQEEFLLVRQGHLDSVARELVREEERGRQEFRAFHHAYMRG